METDNEIVVVQKACKFFPDCEIKQPPYTECFSDESCEKKDSVEENN